MSGLSWTDEQWGMVRSVVQEEAARSRVAGSFLPHYGPLAPDARYVSRQSLESIANPNPPPAEALAVDERAEVYNLATLAVNVEVRSSQVSEPTLESALQMFRRAANVIARLEDSIIFNGQPGPSKAPDFSKVPTVKPEIYTVSGGGDYPSLLHPSLHRPGNANVVRVTTSSSRSLGDALVAGVVEAISVLESNGQLGPFACVLDNEFYVAANTPNKDSLVLPSDRITPFLDGPLLRSSTIPNKKGVVVALAGGPVDIAVGRDIDVKFLQVTSNNRYLFRLQEKFVLRVKDPDAVVILQQSPAPKKK